MMACDRPISLMTWDMESMIPGKATALAHMRNFICNAKPNNILMKLFFSDVEHQVCPYIQQIEQVHISKPSASNPINEEVCLVTTNFSH